VGLLASGSQQEDGWGVEPGPLLELPAHVEPGHAGHADIEDDEVWALGPGRLQGGQPILHGDDLIARSFEIELKDPANVAFVIGDQDPLFHRRPSPVRAPSKAACTAVTSSLTANGLSRNVLAWTTRSCASSATTLDTTMGIFAVEGSAWSRSASS